MEGGKFLTISHVTSSSYGKETIKKKTKKNKKKRNKVSSPKSAIRNPNMDLFRHILQYFTVMPTKEKVWPGKKCTFQTFADLTSE